MNAIDIFDRVLDDGGPAPDTVRALVDLAREVRHALGAGLLDEADHDRIYARALAVLGDAVDENARGWQRVLRGARPAPLLIGGAAAAAVVGAAVGWSILHGRHSRPALAAGAMGKAALG